MFDILDFFLGSGSKRFLLFADNIKVVWKREAEDRNGM